MSLRRAASSSLRQLAGHGWAAEASSSSVLQGASHEALVSAWLRAQVAQHRVISSAWQPSWAAQRASIHCWQVASFAAQPAVVESSDDSQEAEALSAGSKAAKQAASTSQPSPEACDDVASLLKAAQERVDRQKMYGRETTMRDRLDTALAAARLVVVKVVGFITALPQKFLGVLKMTSAERGEMYRGWWTSIKKEAYHYWMGTKLLGTDVRIAARLVSKTLGGKRLSRRERSQLTRTSADVFRLVPMLVFVLVPFMELLLPVALKLFPNMLPSTFEDKLKKEEKLKRSVTAKLEVARFLQDTVEEMAKSMASNEAGTTQASAAELYAFLKRVRAGEAVDNAELTKFAQLFNDELTLDNLERIHLVNLCRFVGIQPFGTDAFLVARLRSHLHTIKRDDKAIENEGLENLTDEELRSACRARGMRAPFGSGAAAFMQRQLHDWLDLSLHRALPSSLLLLSRAFMVSLPQKDADKGAGKDMDQLKEALSSLPDKVIAEASLEKLTDAAEEDLGTEYARKLEELHREEQLINEEELEAEGLLQGDAPSVAANESAQKMTAHAAAAAVVREATASAAVDVFDSGESSDKASRLAAAKEDKMRKVISALGVLASSSGVSNERQIFMELVKTEIGRLNKQLTSKGSVSLVFHAGGVQSEQPKELVQVVGQQRLATKVTSILNRIEEDLDSVDSKIGASMHVLDVDNDGLISKEELQEAMGFLHDQLGEDELRAMLERLNSWTESPDDSIPVSSLMSLAQDAAGPQQMRSAVAGGAPQQ